MVLPRVLASGPKPCGDNNEFFHTGNGNYVTILSDKMYNF